ncbi:MAG TPA: phosphoglucosamine mutase [Longimicrobiales bacterium]|nr:phosphoglucosamine mutase [Longimicrobiales bacterium]
MAFEIPGDLMISVSGVRGRVGEGLTPEVVARFAAAFGAYVSERSGNAEPAVVLARDSRTSGPMYARVVTAALQSVGCRVVDLGLVPTPTALLAIRHHGAAGGIVVTASHNPVEWNALKFASGAGMFLDADEAAAMRSFVNERQIPRAAWDGIGVVAQDDGAVQRHLDAVLAIPFLDIPGLRQRRFRVALDCVRGAGSVLIPRLLEAVGCDVAAIHTEPDGRFPRPPEPVPENLGELGRLVREHAAEIGLAIDPDADRLALVDERGNPVGEDWTLALAATVVLRRRAGTVVTNLSTSNVLEDVARDAGVSLVRAPVGEINVARRMQAEGAVVGGEGNGGVILPDVHLTRDSAVATLLVLQALLDIGQPLSEYLAGRPRYVIVKDKIPRGDAPLGEVFDVLERDLGAPDADRQDGLRLTWPESRRWLHFRASGTEPIIRIIAEAPDGGEASALIQQARRIAADVATG